MLNAVNQLKHGDTVTGEHGRMHADCNDNIVLRTDSGHIDCDFPWFSTDYHVCSKLSHIG